MYQQFVTKTPEPGDTFFFHGIKLIAVASPANECSGCVGDDNYKCAQLPSCFSIVWKFAADQRSNEQKAWK